VQVRLAYGHDGLTVDLPDGTEVIRPSWPAPLADEAAAVIAAVRGPLAELITTAAPRPKVAVVFPDLTRPMPNRTVLPPLLAALEKLGAGPDEVLLLCATGTHRQATAEEMDELIGPEITARYRIKDHDATAAGEHVEVGAVDGTPILIDRDYVAADVRILTGFVEPHFFAGYSGGPKGICPGLAALPTILEAHSPKRIADAQATWTVLEGNPVHDFVRAATAFAPAGLSVDVVLSGDRRLAGVFTGPAGSDGDPGHRQACAFVAADAVRPVSAAFDLVVTTNSGYPLDRNLYQAVKGMTAAARVVRPGGTIVMAAACADGVPRGSRFEELLAAASGAGDLVDPTHPAELDRWQVQVLGRILQHAEVQLLSDGISADEARAAHLTPIDDIADSVRASGARRVAAVPDGPLTVPTLTG
jgi:nickel-dependent lactate racemase